MVWHEAYPADRQPDMEEIDSFIGSPYWKSLCTYVERNYLVTPRIEFSRCTMQTGWNVKYKKVPGQSAPCILNRGSLSV